MKECVFYGQSSGLPARRICGS